MFNVCLHADTGCLNKVSISTKFDDSVVTFGLPDYTTDPVSSI